MGQAVEASLAVRTVALEAANAACTAAVRRANELGVKVNVAVTDASGVLVAFQRMPGSFLHSVEIAIDKAFTAASFGFPTTQWVDVIGHDKALQIGLPLRPRLVIFGGGLPMRDGPALIGGIGVSGGSAAQDEDCARAGLRAAGLAEA